MTKPKRVVSNPERINVDDLTVEVMLGGMFLAALDAFRHARDEAGTINHLIAHDAPVSQDKRDAAQEELKITASNFHLHLLDLVNYK